MNVDPLTRLCDAASHTARWHGWRCVVITMSLGSSLDHGLAHSQDFQREFQRAEQLAVETRNRLYRHVVQPHWLEGQARCWYRVQTGAESHRFILVDARAAERRDAFDHERLARALGAEVQREITADRLPFVEINFRDDSRRFDFVVDGQQFTCEVDSYRLTRGGIQLPRTAAVRVLERPRRSRDRGGETSIRFVNALAQPVRLLWIDRGGGQIPYGEIAAGAAQDQHTFDGHVWLVVSLDEQPLAVFQATGRPGTAVIDGQAKVLPADDTARSTRALRAATSPDGRWQVFLRDFNVWRREVATQVEIQLSDNGSADDPYLDVFHWSDDSQRVVALQEARGDDHKIHLIESSPRDRLEPKLHEIEYAKPGNRIPRPRPRLFDAPAARAIEVADDLCGNPWSITDVRWHEGSRRFSFLYNERGHQLLRTVVVDGNTGETGTLLEERSATFIDYAHKQYTNYLPETSELIWMSERDGWNHLYLFDSATGQLKSQITRGNWVVRRVDRVDAGRRQIWFYAGGIYPEQDPYYLHYCRIDFSGDNLRVLTQGNGTHEVEVSPDGEFLVDQYSRVDLPPVTELRRSDDGSLVLELERADATALSAIDWQVPVRFAAPGRDGQTPIYGVIHFPRHHDAAAKYPVIEKIYAGPQDNFVPKAFATYFPEQSLAELGFIVVQIDGMGTSNRSKAFHDVCWKNLADAGFPDRIAWLRAAAASYPSFDLSRVGIYGGSAGGQSALRALLAHSDVYHVAVADCGCHDNRMDKIWWNELWMGWPVGPHYAEQSNVTQAHRLQGKLLLTVGELDRNVDPASTMQVVSALIRADKDFELLVFPGADHGVGESAYGRRRRGEFFRRHLGSPAN